VRRRRGGGVGTGRDDGRRSYTPDDVSGLERQLGRFEATLRDAEVTVTGGAGFIGSHVVDALLTVGARVRVLDDLSNSDGGRVYELMEATGGGLEFLHASVLDSVALAEAVEGARFVFHLAALGSVPLSLEEPERAWAVNATGTLRVAEACRRAGVERVVYSASSSAYGDAEAMPLGEGAAGRPLSPYAASKLAGEHVVRSYARSMGLGGVSLRYFNIFGPRQPADSAYAAVIPAFIRKLSAGEAPVIYGDGSASRDFCYVDNVVFANLLAATREGAGDGSAYNVACGESTSVGELARMLADLIGRPEIEAVYEPARAGDPAKSLADLSASRGRLGYECLVRVRDGLELTLASWGLSAERAAAG